ncbi:MAG: tRNA pseudouridine(55) synthase TruB, partial [Pseudomonadota bacterium]
IEAGLADLPMIPVCPAGADDLARGARTTASAPPPAGIASAWAAAEGRPVALVTVDGGFLQPTRVFLPPS